MFKFVAALFLALVGAAAGRLSAPDELAAPEKLRHVDTLVAKSHKKLTKKFADGLKLPEADGARRLTGDDDDDCSTEALSYAVCVLSNTACLTSSCDDDTDDFDTDDTPSGDDWYQSCSSVSSFTDSQICDYVDEYSSCYCSDCDTELTDYLVCMYENLLLNMTGLDCDLSEPCSSAATTGLPLFAGTVFAALTMLFAGKAF